MGMTINRLVELLEIEHECMLRKSHNGCDGKCANCDLVQDDVELHEMYTDVIGLLKAQEPRVMTLEEVRDEADHMYLEKHSKTGSDLYGCAIRGDWDGYGIELLMSEYDTAIERWSNYGMTWRCWTSRPTYEQREATPWQIQ